MASWFQQLDDASDSAAVVAIVRDFIATWTPQEIARLPESCRPKRIRDSHDVEELHAGAVEAYRATRASGDELTALQVMTGMLVRASLRLAALRAAEVSPPEAKRRQELDRDR